MAFSIVCLALATSAGARVSPKLDLLQKSSGTKATSTTATRVVEYAGHSRGNIQLAVANNGTFGTFGNSVPDPFTGRAIPSCVYPKNSDIVFLWVGALWAGAVVGRDTLVSCATDDWYEVREFWPEPKPAGNFIRQSIDPNSPFYSPDARSEEDIICVYTDTVTDPSMVGTDPIDRRPHKPLNIKVTQRSMAWSYSYIDDFILFDYLIENIGLEDIDNLYLGIFVDGDVWHVTRNNESGWNDDIVGFYRTHPAGGDCKFIDTINVAWTADNDGDPISNDTRWDYRSALGVVGARVVRTPSRSLEYSYNWWIINYGDATRDFGPRRRGTDTDPYRNLGARMGTPAGDRNRYYVLRHEEFDYDLMYTALDHSGDGWLAPPASAYDYAEGFDARYLLSFGPFDVSPGETLPITFAWVGGRNLHRKPGDFQKYFDPSNPDIYYDALDFSDLARNSRWASWVYDNPGVDTDGDSYLGKFRVCNNDTIYYEGDGVPDFRGASPPPAPRFWIEPTVGALKVRFNGYASETTKDLFSNMIDFEGYRVYLARDERPASYSVVASFDREDFNKWIIVSKDDTIWEVTPDGDTLDFTVGGGTQVELREVPFTLDSLRCLYAPDSCGDPSFNPMDYTRYSPLEYKDSLFYFEPQDFNASRPGTDTPIRKIYPEQPYPSSFHPDSVRPEELTEDGRFKYFEYEVTIEDLLPTVPYWVSVTAFDFGSPLSGLTSLESSPSITNKQAYALSSSLEVMTDKLEAYVFPNPYRIDGNYADAGWENRRGNLATERARRIHFVNVPPKCTIYIYSIDGDLVREIHHDFPPDDPTSTHEEWDLITRNTQAAVTGLYYYVIESAERTQIGKLVILK